MPHHSLRINGCLCGSVNIGPAKYGRYKRAEVAWARCRDCNRLIRRQRTPPVSPNKRCLACNYVIERGGTPLACKLQGNTMRMFSADCPDLVMAQPVRICTECAKESTDWDEFKGVVLCRGCLCPAEYIEAQGRFMSPLYRAEVYGEPGHVSSDESCYDPPFRRAVSAAMTRLGIPLHNPGGRRVN